MKINNKEIKECPLTFNVICQLSDNGLDITDMEKKSLQLLRGWVAICMKTTTEKAGEEIEKHCMNGGDINDILSAFQKAVEDSGFFQSVQGLQKKSSQKEKK